MSGLLSVVATPIGNLKDITLRALEALTEAEVIFCEDTRVTRTLLARHAISTPLRRCDAQVEHACARAVGALLKKGAHVALVSDAGTPAVSDPGARLIRYVRMHVPEARIEAVPGPSAIVAALSISGYSGTSFTFLGFVPHKKGRRAFFESVVAYPHLVIFFESPHRIIKTLTELVAQTGTLSIDRKVFVARELTKLHEELVSGSPEDVLCYFQEHPQHQKGEFVVLVGTPKGKSDGARL